MHENVKILGPQFKKGKNHNMNLSNSSRLNEYLLNDNGKSIKSVDIFYRDEPIRKLALDKTIYSAIREGDNYKLDDIAIGFMGSHMTYRTLFQNADRLADAYHKAGLKEGDTVALLTISMPVVQENLLALSKIGVTSKWIDLRIKGKELVNKLNENHCRFIVVFDGVLDEIIQYDEEIIAEKILIVSPADYLNPVIGTLAKIKNNKKLGGRYIDYKSFLKKGSRDSALKPVQFKKDRISLIVQSSGSTGISKSIIHTEYNFNSKMAQESFSDLPLDICKTMYVAIPPFIIYGLCNSIYAALYFGMKAEMTPYVSDDTVFNDLGKYDVVCAAPVHYRYMYKTIMEYKNVIFESKDINEVNTARKKLDDIYIKLKKVNLFVSGGDAVSVKELLNMQQTFGVQVINGYGNNEVGGAAIISTRFAPKPASIGIPLKGVEVYAFSENNEQLPALEEGELCISSDNLFIEYVNNQEETDKIKQQHDGKMWIHTGDLGYLDEDGFVYITGRSKRLIRRKAFKIAPETIEREILDMSEIQDCVVVAVEDEEDGEVPFAFITINTASGISENEILERVMSRCKDTLPDYELPKFVVGLVDMPYKNGKHDFGTLTTMASDYVKNI